MFHASRCRRKSVWLLLAAMCVCLSFAATKALAQQDNYVRAGDRLVADDQDLEEKLAERLLEFHTRTAWNTLNRGDLERAEAMFRDILRRDPARPEEIAGLSAALARQNKLDDAIDVLRDGVSRYPRNAMLASALGQGYLNTDANQAAMDNLEQAFDLDPDMPDLPYFLGSSYLKCQYPLLALDMLCGAETSRREMAWAQDLALGTAFSQLGLQAEASGYFMSVLEEAAGTPMAENASQLQDDMDEAFFGREYLRGSIKITERYDTNPGVIPAANVVAVPLASIPSWGNLYQGQISYDIIRDYDWDVTAGYSFLHTNNYAAHNFDIVDDGVYLASVHRNYWHGRPVNLGVRVDYDHLFLGSDDFLQRMVVTPSLAMIHSDWDATTALVRYTLYDFLGQGVFDGTPFDLDADDLAVGLLHERQLFGRDMVVYAGYEFDHNFSEGSNFDYNGHKVQVGARWQTPVPELTLLANGQLYIRNYDNPNSIFGVNRYDEEYLVQVSFAYQLLHDLDVVLEWNFDRNESNLPTNDYRRHTVELGLQYFFPSGRSDRL